MYEKLNPIQFVTVAIPLKQEQHNFLSLANKELERP